MPPIGNTDRSTDPPARAANPSTDPAPKTDLSAAGAPRAGAAEHGDAIAMLKADHRHVEDLFAKFKTATSGRDELVRQICMELSVHTALEEEIFYPACRRTASDDALLDQAQVEHDSAKVLIADLMREGGAGRYRDAKVNVLAEQIKQHITEEEAPATGILARAQAAGVNAPELFHRMQARKQALTAERDRLAPLHPVSFDVAALQHGQPKEDRMTYYRGYENDRGRYMDDDEWRSRGGPYRAGEERYDDNRRYGYGQPQGRNAAHRGERRSFDEDDYRYHPVDFDQNRRAAYAGNGDPRDDYHRAGQRGSYGYHEGYAQEARRDWDDRRGDRDYDNDRGYRSFGSDDPYYRAERGMTNRGQDYYGQRAWDDARHPDDHERRSGEGRGAWSDQRGQAYGPNRGWQGW
jgi:hypothetical protein